MVLDDLARELEGSLRATSEVLRALLRGLQQRRCDWASARPGVLAPSAELERLAAALQEAERTRAALLRRVAEALPREPGVDAADLHITVSRLAAALSVANAARLQAAADQATALARSVRGEVAFGERLLRNTAAAHDAMLGELAGSTTRAQAACGYDHRARMRAAAGHGSPRLVDGKA